MPGGGERAKNCELGAAGNGLDSLAFALSVRARREESRRQRARCPIRSRPVPLNGFSRFRDDQAVCVSRPSSTGRASGTQGNSLASVS